MSTEPPGWLDIHGHFFPPRPESDDAAMIKALCEANFMVSEAPKWNPEAIIAYNDRAGISMQMLSHLPATTEQIRKSTDFGMKIVQRYPSRFGLLAGLPTDDPDEAVKEIERMRDEGKPDIIPPDGFAVTTIRNGVGLGDSKLRPIWEALDRRGEVIFVHPNAYVKGQDGRPSALIDVAFDTTRMITDMLYNRVFLDFPRIKWAFAHSGGAFPALSGRILLLGTESWVPNPTQVTKHELKEQISRIYVDTAATAATGMEPAIKMVGIEHIVYGADCGVPCSTESTLEENRRSVIALAQKSTGDGDVVGRNGFDLFPDARMRAAGNH